MVIWIVMQVFSEQENIIFSLMGHFLENYETVIGVVTLCVVFALLKSFHFESKQFNFIFRKSFNINFVTFLL